MNYDDLLDFIKKNTVRSDGRQDIINMLDKAIGEPCSDRQSFYLSNTIAKFRNESASYEADISFIRAAIEYIDGLNENQDNGDES